MRVHRDPRSGGRGRRFGAVAVAVADALRLGLGLGLGLGVGLTVCLGCSEDTEPTTDFDDSAGSTGDTGPSSTTGTATTGATGTQGTTGSDDSEPDDSSNDDGGGPIFDVGGGGPVDTGADDDGCTKVDFLFVIDTSGSMGQEQEALKQAFPGFIQKIQASGIKDYHVAVTTADMGYCSGNFGFEGDNGEFQWIPENGDPTCAPLAKKYIEGPSDTSTAEFQCIAERFGGSGIEMTLQGAYSALVDRMQDGTNPIEFRRQDALLVVLYITDEDDQSALSGGTDCSSEPVSLYTTLYEQAVLKGNPTAGVFVAISGPATTVCSSDLGSASPAPRLHEFIDHWGPRGHWSNICNGNFPEALEAALATIEFGCETFDPEG